MLRRLALAPFVALVACAGAREPAVSSVSASPSASTSTSTSGWTPTATVSASASGSASVATAPPAPADPWAGPLSWSRTPISCALLLTKAAASSAKGWTARKLVGVDALSSVAIAATNVDDVWFVGAHGVLVHTPDHGKTFERCDLGVDDVVQSISAVSPDDVWLLGDERVMRVEKRATLAVLSKTLEPHCGVPSAGVLALSSGEVWIANATLRVSNDGGASWSRRKMLGSSFGDECIDEIHGDAHDLWTDAGFALRHSVDGGATWSVGSWEPGAEADIDIAVGGDGEVWVAAHFGATIAHSTDHGATWIEEDLAPPLFDRRISGLAAVGQGWAWAYADGTWVRRGKPPWVRETMKATAFVGTSKDDVWALGAGGLVLHRP